MKYVTTFILFANITFGFSQDFKTDLNTIISVPAQYISSTKSAIITNDKILIHQRDILEVVDLNTNKLLYTWDPEGGYGETWIDEKGRFAGNYSQNVKDENGKWANIFQVIDLNTKKVYSRIIGKSYWNKGSFSPNKNEVLVNSYDAKTKITSAVLYDFVKGEVVRTFFSSTKFSTVIMALSFSKDGSKVYLGIAENSSVSYLKIMDRNTGTLIKKISLSYQMDKFFVKDEFVFTSGSHGSTGNPYTTKFNASDFSKKAEWKFRIHNTNSTGTFAIQREYKSNTLTKYNLNDGTKTTLLDVSLKGDFTSMSGLSINDQYYFVAVKRKGILKEQSGEEALLIFKNTTMQLEEVKKPTSSLNWELYVAQKAKFQIDFPLELIVDKGQTDKGLYTLSLKKVEGSTGFISSAIELSKDIEPAKFTEVSERTALVFMKKMNQENLKKVVFEMDGEKGVEYTYKVNSLIYTYRCITINGFSYQLIYVDAVPDPKKQDRFFGSFKVLK